MSRYSISTHRRFQRLKTLVLAAYGGTCSLCGHPGANSIHHVIPASWELIDPWDVANWRPAHGGGVKCSTCQIECNSRAGTKGKLPQLNTSRRW